MSNLLPMLEAEIAEIERELAADPRYLKLGHLRQLAALYRGPSKAQAEDVSNAAGKGVTAAPSKEKTATTQRQKMLEDVEELLKVHDVPTKTVILYEYLRAQGYQIGGKDAVSNLSAMLANSGRFRSHGRSLGWTLRDWEPPAERSFFDAEPVVEETI